MSKYISHNHKSIEFFSEIPGMILRDANILLDSFINTVDEFEIQYIPEGLLFLAFKVCKSFYFLFHSFIFEWSHIKTRFRKNAV